MLFAEIDERSLGMNDGSCLRDANCKFAMAEIDGRSWHGSWNWNRVRDYCGRNRVNAGMQLRASCIFYGENR